MSILLDFCLLCFGFFLLTKGADYFIENSASFAEEKGICLLYTSDAADE